MSVGGCVRGRVGGCGGVKSSIIQSTALLIDFILSRPIPSHLHTRPGLWNVVGFSELGFLSPKDNLFIYISLSLSLSPT